MSGRTRGVRLDRRGRDHSRPARRDRRRRAGRRGEREQPAGFVCLVRRVTSSSCAGPATLFLPGEKTKASALDLTAPNSQRYFKTFGRSHVGWFLFDFSAQARSQKNTTLVLFWNADNKDLRATPDPASRFFDMRSSRVRRGSNLPGSTAAISLKTYFFALFALFRPRRRAPKDARARGATRDSRRGRGRRTAVQAGGDGGPLHRSGRSRGVA